MAVFTYSSGYLLDVYQMEEDVRRAMCLINAVTGNVAPNTDLSGLATYQDGKFCH